jgi:hypothetical protein
MMRRLVAAALLVLLSAVSWADQAAWISKKDAEAAAARIKSGDEVREYCKPCGDKGYGVIKVTRVEVAHTGEGDYYEVRLNGKGIDLAYVYIRSGGEWENLAMIVGVSVQDVPRYLPKDLPRKRT